MVALSDADFVAIRGKDSDFLLSKGAEKYGDDYEESIEYYRLSAAMGNPQAISNLGYCYLYGRSIEPNVSLALAYFTVAADLGVIDALYKLGNIYSSDEFVDKDEELEKYYYEKAIDALLDSYSDYEDYPSLSLAVAKETMEDGLFDTDLDRAYFLLKCAENGFKKYIDNGDDFYEDHYAETLDLLEDKQFDDEIKDNYNQIYENEEDDVI
ncbi:MAG: sel1 repeat family protein [Bacilli bacterium]|nr:sel1 repeat family protein [Bacilli bacterium]